MTVKPTADVVSSLLSKRRAVQNGRVVSPARGFKQMCKSQTRPKFGTSTGVPAALQPNTSRQAPVIAVGAAPKKRRHLGDVLGVMLGTPRHPLL